MPATRAECSAFTLRCYDGLPQVVRDADAQLDGMPLLTYFATMLEQLAGLDVLVDRLSYVPEDEVRVGGQRTSALVDPDLGDAAWLPWQALIYGVRIDLAADVATQRAQVGGIPGGWMRGSNASIVAAAQTALTGSRSCTLIPHYHGDPMMIAIMVLASEIADGLDASVIAAVDAADCRPAGKGLTVVHYVSSWDAQEAAYPTWTAREAAGSWDVIEQVGAP
jgi:hypothetical protein